MVYRKECVCTTDGHGNTFEYRVGDEVKVTLGNDEVFFGLVETIGYFELEIWIIDTDMNLEFCYDEIDNIEEWDSE